jgi:hypothetical protein
MTEIWLKRKEDSENIFFLRMLAVKENLPQKDYAAIVTGNYKIIPNDRDNRGGVFLIIDSTSSKKWWQFWK